MALDNHRYNLVAQLAQESKSLQRIRENYQHEHENCGRCAEFWQRMEEDKENHIAELTEMLKEHLE